MIRLWKLPSHPSLSLRAKRWLRGGVGGQISSRNIQWSGLVIWWWQLTDHNFDFNFKSPQVKWSMTTLDSRYWIQFLWKWNLDSGFQLLSEFRIQLRTYPESRLLSVRRFKTFLFVFHNSCTLSFIKVVTDWISHSLSKPLGGHSRKACVEVCRRGLQNLTLCKTIHLILQP